MLKGLTKTLSISNMETNYIRNGNFIVLIYTDQLDISQMCVQSRLIFQKLSNNYREVTWNLDLSLTHSSFRKREKAPLFLSKRDC